MASPTNLLVMCSGSGTNLQAIIDASIPNTRIVRVIVNRKTAYATTRAAQAGIPTTYYNLIKDGYHKAGEKDPAVLKTAREKYDADLAAKALEEKPDLIILAGWMHVFSAAFLDPLAEKGIRVINLHPALPGQFDGSSAIERAYDAFQAGKLKGGKTGCMIHYVTAEVDRGQPILVQEVECREGESLDDLENRIHAVEHEIIVRATEQVVKELRGER